MNRHDGHPVRGVRRPAGTAESIGSTHHQVIRDLEGPVLAQRAADGPFGAVTGRVVAALGDGDDDIRQWHALERQDRAVRTLGNGPEPAREANRQLVRIVEAPEAKAR